MDGDPEQKSGWIRGALLLAFAAGLVGGFIVRSGVVDGWTGSLGAVAVASLVLLMVANYIVTLSLRKPEERIPLPGELYGDRKRPDPHELEGPELEGRVPFKASKQVVQRSADPKMDKLYDTLNGLNQQLQRANVKLGLGELSNEGYQRVVAEIKERRAEVEHMIAHREMADGAE